MNTDDETTPAPLPYPVVNDPLPVRTAEEWATAKGLLPQFIDRVATLPPSRGPRALTFAALPTRTINPRYAAFAAAKAMHLWPDGAELTECDFDAAVTAARNVVIR